MPISLFDLIKMLPTPCDPDGEPYHTREIVSATSDGKNWIVEYTYPITGGVQVIKQFVEPM